MEAIKAVKLTKHYKATTAVDSLDLSIGDGELFALLGVNGAGKTTTVKMLSCLLEPTDGNAFIHGKSIVDDKNEVKRMIAVSPQETAVAAGLTVNENLKLICGVHGFSKLRAEERTELLLDRLGLCEVKDKKAGKLSGGWQRRLSIAMALISEPRVLFLDEPTLGLDVIARSELWDIVRALKGSITVVLTTHYMEEAEALSDRIGIMKRGRLIACATADEIKQRTGQSRFEDAFISIVREDD